MWRVEIASVLIRTCLQSRFDRGSLYKGGSFEECSSEHQSSTQGDRVRRPSDRKHGGSLSCREEDLDLEADGGYLGWEQAGAGNILGATWEDLATIIEHVENKDRVGVCIDTCELIGQAYPVLLLIRRSRYRPHVRCWIRHPNERDV